MVDLRPYVALWETSRKTEALAAAS